MSRPADAPLGTDRHPTDLLPGYLLAELPEREMEAVEAHLRDCEACSAELAELDATFVDAVESLPDASPPAGAWERIEARTANVVPAPARTAAPADDRDARSGAASGRSERAGTHWPSWLGGLAAGLALAVAVGAWGTVQRGAALEATERAERAEARAELLSEQIGTVQARADGLAEEQALLATWLAREDAVVRGLDGDDPDAPSAGSVVLLPDGRALLVMRDPPGEGRDFQAWGVRGEEVASLGVFTGRVAEVRADDFDAVAVSLEPSGGSDTPTLVLGAASAG